MEQSNLLDIMTRRSNKTYHITKRKVTYWFNRINLLVFKNKLDKFKNVIIEELYDKKKFIMAEIDCHDRKNPYAYLHINTTFKNIQFFLSILGHEMVHLYQWTYEGKLNHTKESFLNPWKDKFAKHGLVLKVSY